MNEWSCNTAVAAGLIVTCDMAIGLEGPPGETCDYAPPPFDVISRRGFVSVAFSDFPIT